MLNRIAESPQFVKPQAKLSTVLAGSEGDWCESPAPGLPTTSLAYVIYTSGTTGRPKGVAVEHRQLAAYLAAFDREFAVTGADIALQQASYTFDAFVEEFYPVLINGGKLVIAPRDIVLDVERLVLYMARLQVTLVSGSPLLLQEMNRLAESGPDGVKNPFSGLRILISGGDRLAKAHIDRLAAITRVYNTYGPTETTVCATYYRCPPGDALADWVSIGKPIAHYRVYILDRFLNVLPIGLAGELCIAGPGLSRGYLNNPELTAERFVTSPLTTHHSPITYRLYKTGDRARWLDDGNIEFLGRIDQQVKIRGFRIEPGEIEAQLLRHPAIKEVAVIDVKDTQGESYLCAYIAPVTAGTAIDTTALSPFLAQTLPAYMIPAYFIELGRIPRTPGGKVDRQALPTVEARNGQERVLPRDPLEEQLARVWAEVLGLDGEATISIDDDFFKRGGHSLRATRLLLRIRREWHIQVPLLEIFNRPTIRSQADFIRERAGAGLQAKETGLLLLRPGSDNALPLFFIHDGTGEVDGYLEFCRLLPERYACYGLRADFPGLAPQEFSIPGLAAHYIEKIKTVQASGPYALVGWSLGGLIGFDMARQLEQAGEKIGLLVLVDAPPPGDGPADVRHSLERGFSLADELAWLKEHLDPAQYDRIKGSPDSERLWQVLVEYLGSEPAAGQLLKKVVIGYGGGGIAGLDHLSARETVRYLNILRSFARARWLYRPQGNLDAAVHYFRADDSPIRQPGLWEQFCGRGIDFYPLKGDHYSIFKLPLVSEMVDRFSALL